MSAKTARAEWREAVWFDGRAEVRAAPVHGGRVRLVEVVVGVHRLGRWLADCPACGGPVQVWPGERMAACPATTPAGSAAPTAGCGTEFPVVPVPERLGALVPESGDQLLAPRPDADGWEECRSCGRAAALLRGKMALAVGSANGAGRCLACGGDPGPAVRHPAGERMRHGSNP